MTDIPKNTLSPEGKRKKSWVSLLALIAILIAGAAWFQLVHQQKRSTHNFSQLQNSFHQTLSSTAQLDQTTTDLQTQVANQTQQIQALQAALNRLQAANTGYETDTALQQVERYLSQANLSLTFSHDIAGAITLLQAADQRLNSVPESQVLPLRQAIANNIIKLQAIPQLDNVGILTKLNALRDQTASIPLFAIKAKAESFTPKENSAALVNHAATTWRKTWQTTLQTLHTLVVIRNRDQNITPLISETQEQFLRQNLQLILQQAEWAVLQHDSSVYQFSLTQASEWIQRYFADNDQATIAMQNNINELRKINLNPTVPDMGPLLNQLHSLQMQMNRTRTSGVIAAPAAPAPVTPAQTLKNAEAKGDLV